MKLKSSKIILLNIALIIAFGVMALSALFAKVLMGGINVFFVSFFFFISLLTSLVLICFVDYFVLKKNNDLLLLVQKFRLQYDKSGTTTKPSNNEIEKLKFEIEAWAQDRKNEIERLQKLEVYRKEFLGNVSHELKTPVFNIQGYVLTLLDGGLEDESINRNYLMRAEKSVDRMIMIIDDLNVVPIFYTKTLFADLTLHCRYKVICNIFVYHDIIRRNTGLTCI